jgi:hypothetical protein
MKMSRHWSMPDSNTFSVAPIRRFIQPYIDNAELSVDPFANTNRLASITNDIDPEMGCNYTMDALEFLQMLPSETFDLVLFDPPYSPRQVSEVYRKMGMSVNMETTQGSFWADLRDQIQRIVKPGGWCLSFGWSSNGIGKSRGFELMEVMLVAHGGAHYDTICTAERKTGQLSLGDVNY